MKRNIRRILSVFVLVFSLFVPVVCYGQTVSADKTSEAAGRQVRIIIEDRLLTATLIDNETARDFITLLPVTITMHEFRNREKYGRLPRSLVRGGVETHAYEVGDVIYAPERSNLAFFYAADIRGTDIPVIVIGKINSGIEAFESVRGTYRSKSRTCKLNKKVLIMKKPIPRNERFSSAELSGGHNEI